MVGLEMGRLVVQTILTNKLQCLYFLTNAKNSTSKSNITTNKRLSFDLFGMVLTSPLFSDLQSKLNLKNIYYDIVYCYLYI